MHFSILAHDGLSPDQFEYPLVISVHCYQKENYGINKPFLLALYKIMTLINLFIK